MTRSLISCVCALALLLSTACDGTTANVPALPNYSMLGPCPRPEQVQMTSIAAESLCGKITVPENPAAPDGRQVHLNVMVMPATGRSPRPEPLFVLAGGPGQAATEAGPLLFAGFTELRRERDIVLVDQRGTGASNPLNCEVDDNGLELADLTIAVSQERALAAAKTCLAGYDADTRFYTTPIAMTDLDTVRQRLGITKLNLYGISYGSRAALVYMRHYGEHVRAAVLDGVYPPTMSMANVAMDADAAMQRLFADCSADADCAAAFPDLRAEFQQLLKRLNETPFAGQALQPRTGETIETRADGIFIGRIVRQMLYDRTVSSLLPLAIHEAAAGRMQPLMSMGMAYASEEGQLSFGMMVSVLCAEDIPRFSVSGDADALFDNAVFNTIRPMCDFWPSGTIDADYSSAVKSEVPVLLLSGALDPITPPQYASEAAQTLPNSQHIVADGIGHGVAFSGCAPELITDFLADPTQLPLDAKCLATLKRAPFFTSFAGPVAHD